MIVSIHQPNYIPWTGYFHKIYHSDVFVILDTVQYVKGTVANKNSIKGKSGMEVPLSVSVKLSNGFDQKYSEIAVDYSSKWHIKHLNQLKDAYQKAPFFDAVFPAFRDIVNTPYQNIADLNTTIIKWVADYLSINTKMVAASSLQQDFGSNNLQNVNLCKAFNADAYLSGNGARKYNDEQLYTDNGIKLLYTRFPLAPYPQLHGDFIPSLSILDMLFNVSPGDSLALVAGKDITYQ